MSIFIIIKYEKINTLKKYIKFTTANIKSTTANIQALRTINQYQKSKQMRTHKNLGQILDNNDWSNVKRFEMKEKVKLQLLPNYIISY